MTIAAPPDLSIIVPIYNVEEFLPQCLDSIIAQNIDNLEVVLINDGTQDSSGEIAKSYTERHPALFRYIEQANQGLSVARNVGIENSSGTYLTFLDSDDFLTENGLNELLTIAKDSASDIVIGNLWHYFEDSSKEKNRAFISVSQVSGEDWLRQCMRQRKYFPAAWCRLLRRDFIVSNKLYFIPQLINEDQVYTVQTMQKATSVTTADIPFYMYRHRSGSITRTANPAMLRRSAESDVKTTLILLDLCVNNFDRELTKLVMSQCIKLLRTSGAPLYAATDGNDPLIADTAQKMNELKLYRYQRIYRLSQLVDWVMLRIDFRRYLAWRSRKMKPRK